MPFTFPSLALRQRGHAGDIARFALILVLLFVVLPVPAAYADGPGHDEGGAMPAILENARFDQRLGAQAPLDLTFRDETGRSVRLEELFGQKPVVLTLNYYECPNLCPLVVDGLLVGLVGVPFAIGEDYNVVTVGIDPSETPEDAAKVKNRIMTRFKKRPAGTEGWRFLTGDEGSIRTLAAAVGFNYAYDEQAQQYAHPSGAIVLTPSGKISRYIYGVEFSPRDLRLALVEASKHKIGSVIDQILLFCYRYDPTTGKYTPVALKSLRLASAATILALGLSIGLMVRRERRQNRRREETVG